MMAAKILSTEYFYRNRFCLTKFQTRFGDIEYHVSDSTTVSDHDVRAGRFAEIVAQVPTRREAFAAMRRLSVEPWRIT